ncbi:MAG TPA: tetratricopeptide repeat protein [Candidatus Didemnitutus sp.]|nr:tetratricopeptide repeat protein [Candidatus Didemnitutus sp.]
MPAPTAAPTGSISAEMAEARSQFTRGNQPAALNLAIAVLKKDPRCFDAYVLLSELSITKTDGGPLAEKMARQALALKPGDANVQRLLAQALGLQGRLPETAEVLEKVLQAQPRNLAVTLALAKTREAMREFPAAEKLLRAASAEHSNVAAVTATLGDFLKRRGMLDEALSLHRRAAGASGDIPPVEFGANKVRVAFLVQYPQGWTSLKSAWAAFSADTGCAVKVIAAPFKHPSPNSEAIYGFLEKEGVPFVRWTDFKWEPGFADVLFVQLPYDDTRPPALSAPELLKLVPRLAYVPYALEIGGGSENINLLINQPLHQLAWAIFARSPRHKAAFARYCATGGAHVAVTGHPKMDALRQLDLVRDEELVRFAEGRRLVVWNPHFDVRPDGSEWGTGYSTFLRWEKFMIAEFARRPELALAIRPHPLFFDALQQRQIMSEANIADFTARCAQAGNIHIDRRPSYLPVFAASTAMLSDASSFVLEYAATGKPLLYLHNPKGPGLNADGDFVRAHCATAQTESEITQFLDRVAAGSDPAQGDRMAAFQREFMHLPAEGAGEAIRRATLARLKAESAVPMSIAAAG